MAEIGVQADQGWYVGIQNPNIRENAEPEPEALERFVYNRFSMLGQRNVRKLNTDSSFSCFSYNNSHNHTSHQSNAYTILNLHGVGEAQTNTLTSQRNSETGTNTGNHGDHSELAPKPITNWCQGGFKESVS